MQPPHWVIINLRRRLILPQHKQNDVTQTRVRAFFRTIDLTANTVDDDI